MKNLQKIFALIFFTNFAFLHSMEMENNNSELTTLPNELLCHIVIASDLYSTVQTVLPLIGTNKYFWSILRSEDFTNMLSKKFHANSCSVAVILGNFERKEYSDEKKRLILKSTEDGKSKNFEVQRYMQGKDMSGPIALVKYGISLYGYDEKTNMPREYSDFVFDMYVESKGKPLYSKDFFILLMHCCHPDINTPDKFGRTILDAASLLGRPKIIKFLFSHGANPLLCKEKGVSLAENVSDGLHTQKCNNYSQYATIKKRYNKTLKFLLELNINVNPSKNARSTPLIGATIFGQRKMVKMLLTHGADRSFIDFWRKTALDWATSEYKNISIVKLLEA